jgi:hypothetical protein
VLKLVCNKTTRAMEPEHVDGNISLPMDARAWVEMQSLKFVEWSNSPLSGAHVSHFNSSSTKGLQPLGQQASHAAATPPTHTHTERPASVSGPGTNGGQDMRRRVCKTIFRHMGLKGCLPSSLAS